MNILEILVFYRNIGLPLFPMEAVDGRMTPVGDWQRKEQPTLEELTEWSEKYTAWGTVAGESSGIVSVVVDSRDEAEIKLGCSLYSKMMVRTPLGIEIYYKWTSDIKEAILIDKSPVKFKDSGRILILPPSKTLEGVYEWLQCPTDTSKSLLPEVPKEIKALLDGVTKKEVKDWTYLGDESYSSKPKSVTVTPKTTMDVALERIEERKYEADAPKTGYPTIDRLIKGWIPGHLYIFTGQTNAGKTQCACNFAHRVIQQGKNVTYFALEPDAGVIEYIAGIHHKKRWSDITDNDLRINLKGMNIFTKETHPKLADLLNTIDKMEHQDLIIVDHIGYFTSNPDDRRSKTDQESDAIKRIVGAAKKSKTAIMLIAHPRKPQSKKDTSLSMNEISGSAAFKQDATDVIILDREKDKSDTFNLTNLAEGVLQFPKVKAGKSGIAKVYFVPESPVMLSEEEQANQQSLNFI